MEGVAEMMKSLQLSAAEKKGVRVGGVRRKEKGSVLPQAIGKLLSEKPAPPKALIQSVGKLWCPIRGVDCKDLGENHFLFSFYQAAGKRKALEEGPWMLSNECLVMAEFDGSKTLEEIDFSTIPIWVRITKLPLGLMSRETGELLGDEIGEFMEADVGEDGMATGSVLRVKIKLNIQKPLMRGVTVQTEDGPERWCPVLYEYLPDFCYVCGIIGHTEKACSIKLKKGEVLQFGKELRFRPARKWNDGSSGRSLETAGGGSGWRRGSYGRWGSGGGSGGGLSRSDGPSWKRSESGSKHSSGKDGLGEKEVTSPLKSLPALITNEEGSKSDAMEKPPSDGHMSSALQVIDAGNNNGHGEKELEKKETQKESLRKFRRLPRSNNTNDDKMEIDAKKRLFSSDDAAELDENKKQKLVGEESGAFLNAGLSEQPCEKK